MPKQRVSRRDFLAGAAVVAAALPAADKGAAPAAPTVLAGTAGKPAILGGTPVRSEPFPTWPVIEKLDELKFLESLRRKEWCRLDGETVTAFEKEWARALGAEYVTGVVNGTNAIYAALEALDVGPGDEVLVPPYTFVATVNAVIQLYALPVFVDSDPESFQVDASKLEAKINGNTRCILPVHLGGNVADMDRILALSKSRGIPVVEDACQSHLSEWRGRKVGTLGDIGCFSFQASKILPCGEGGALVTNREDLLDRFHAFQNNGRDRLTGTRDGYLHQGTNLRMTEYQAALLLAQLTRLDAQCRMREAHAARLTSLLGEIPGVRPVKMYEGCTRNTYYIYMARFDSRELGGLSRAQFLQAIRREGIPCGGGYRRLNEEPFLAKTLASRGYRRIYSDERLRRYRDENDCPANNRLAEEGLFFSQRILMGSAGDVEQVAEAIARIRKHASDIAKL